jgi:cob(I)alamin adenosyltransferase
MVKLTKIYTRTGDEGKTHLAGGKRIAKTSVRIEAIGDIDELNSWMGMIATQLDNTSRSSDLLQQCYTIQQQLFNLGAELVILPQDKRDDSPHIILDNIETLEQHIDLMNNDLPTLTSFILPGGNEISASIHIARSVCRRAERQIFRLIEAEGEVNVGEFPVKYINRLSDWLFVAARYVCHVDEVAETLWTY